MKVMLKKVLATLLFCTWAPFASAPTASTDFTDMWWVGPAESGWGANVIQQGDTLFITLFVYGINNQPTWYVGPATAYQGTVAGAQRFTGLLYKVSGPYFGAPVFDTTTVNVTSVASITFTAPEVRADLDSIGMRMDFARGSCHMVGRLGGMRSITAP